MSRRNATRDGEVQLTPSAMLKVVRNLELDQRAATQKFGIIGRSEAGKTYLAGKLVEELHRVGCQVIILDPVGVWWGVTLAANGKDPGLPFVVLGGKRGQLPLSAESGRVVAKHLVDRGLSGVVDLTGLRKRRRPGRAGEAESELQRFVADFQEEALEASQRDPKPRMVVYDEAQMILPQVVSSGGERMLGTGEDLVRTGRNSGWGFVLMSQRPQSINKEVLSQVECFFVGQLTEPHARNRLKEWIVEKKADVRTELDELVKLERGQFYVWSPQWLGVFKKTRVLAKWTFDSSRTPELGTMRLPGAARQSAVSTRDLEALRTALEAREASPPAPARGRLATSTGDATRLRELEKAKEAAEAEVSRLRGELEEHRHMLRQVYERLGGLLGTFEASAVTSAKPVRPSRPEEAASAETVDATAKPRTTHRRPAPTATAGVPSATGKPGLDKCQRAILTVLAQLRKPTPKGRLALMAGYSANSGGFNNALARLRTSGRIEGRGDLAITPDGLEAIGQVPPLPQGSALFEYWLQHPRLDKCCRAIVTALRSAERAVGKAELAELTGYSANSGGFNNALSKLRTLGLIEGRGAVELVEGLRA